MQPNYPQKVLFLSDTHIGAVSSNFAAYQASIIERMTRYDHVVMAGDSWELFYVDRDHVKALSRLMEVLTGKDAHLLQKEFDTSGTARSGVENIIHGAMWFTEEFLERFPNVHLHVIGGNHENVRRMRNSFAALQETHPRNFEWSPEAIRIGDALITHGHLPISGKTDGDYPQVRLRSAENKSKWREIVRVFGPAEHTWQSMRRSNEKTARIIQDQLQEWDGTGNFRVSHNGVHEKLAMDWVRHVFTGHTHVKFNHVAANGTLHHNTGAVVLSTSQRPEDLGILEGQLNADLTLTDIRPVGVLMDSGLAPPPATSRTR